MTTNPLAALLLEIIWNAASPATPHTAEALADAARRRVVADILAERKRHHTPGSEGYEAMSAAAYIAAGGSDG